MRRFPNVGTHASSFSILNSLEQDQRLELFSVLHDLDEYDSFIPVSTDNGLEFLSCTSYGYVDTCTFDVLTAEEAAAKCTARLKDVYDALQSGYDNDCGYDFYNDYSRIAIGSDTFSAEFTSDFLVSLVNMDSVRDLNDVLSDIETYENDVVSAANKRHDLVVSSGSFVIQGSEDSYRQLFDRFDDSLSDNSLWISRVSNERCWTFVPVTVNDETMFCDISSLVCDIDSDGLQAWSSDKYFDDNNYFVGLHRDILDSSFSGVSFYSLKNPSRETYIGEFISDNSVMITRDSGYRKSDSDIDFGNVVRFVGDDVAIVSPFALAKYPDLPIYSRDDVIEILETSVLTPVENPYADPVEVDDSFTEDFQPTVLCRVSSDGYEQCEWGIDHDTAVSLVDDLVESASVIDVTDVVRRPISKDGIDFESWSELGMFVPSVDSVVNADELTAAMPSQVSSELDSFGVDMPHQHETGDFGE